MEDHETVITAELAGLADGGTRVTVTHERYCSPQDRDGWPLVLARRARHCARHG